MPRQATPPRTPRGLTYLFLGASWCSPLTALAEAPRSIIELPTLGGSTAIARAINVHGTVMGESHDGRNARNSRDARAAWKVFLMPIGGPMVQLEQFAGLDPMLINDRDVVVGERFGSNAQRYGAFMWTKQNGTVDLPAPPGARYGHPVDLDNDNNVLMNVGSGEGAKGYLLQAREGRFVALPCLPDHTCRTVAMNAVGRIAGIAVDDPDEDGELRERAIVWSSATTVPTLLPGGEAVRPVAINDRGTVVGEALVEEVEHVVAWRDATLGPIDFGVGSPRALNDRDVAAGTIPAADARGPTALPALWDLSRSARVSLPPLNPQDDFLEIVGINDAGDVAGTAYDADGNGHPVLYRGYAPAGIAP